MKNKNLINYYLKNNLFFKKFTIYIVLVELKCGTTCSGLLKGIDDYFNILINQVIITASNGKVFYEALVVFIKGKAVRYLRILESD
nr:small nuclear ribonucleoprotein D-like protein [Cryptomonas curvata]